MTYEPREQRSEISLRGPASSFSLTGARVWVAGHRGMVGSAIVRHLEANENCTLLRASREELELTRQAETEDWVFHNKPDVIVIAAARVGGILANSTYPANFIEDNLSICMNIVRSAYRNNVKKLIFLGSTCIYPKFAPQPIREESLLTGPLEETNEWYAIAKIAGIKLCQAYRKQHGVDYITAQPTNLYGPNDNYDPESSHVMAALIAKIAKAKAEKRESVTIWGSGTPRREFLHVDDLANAVIFLLKNYSCSEPINIGTGRDIDIISLAHLISEVANWKGRFELDTSKPDGTPRKLVDASRIHDLGWAPKWSLKEGIQDTYRRYCEDMNI